MRNLSMKKFGTPTGTAPGEASEVVGLVIAGAPPVLRSEGVPARSRAGACSRGLRGLRVAGACWQPVVADLAPDAELTTPPRRASSGSPVEAARVPRPARLAHVLVAGSSSVAGLAPAPSSGEPSPGAALAPPVAGRAGGGGVGP